MTKGSNFWVIGGEFGSMNFHKLVEGSLAGQRALQDPSGSRRLLEEFRKRTATRPASASPSWKSPPASRRKARYRRTKKKTSKDESGPIR